MLKATRHLPVGRGPDGPYYKGHRPFVIYYVFHDPNSQSFPGECAMKLKNILMGAVLLAVPCGMQAQVTVKRVYKTPNARIANVIWAGDTLYLSGMGSGPKTPADPAKGTPAVWGNTEEQCTGAFTAIQAALKEQGLDRGDIFEMQIFLAADPANGNKIDVPAMNRAYAKFFGTPE